MSKKALFEGLIVDEFDRPVSVAYVGDEACYVVDDYGFHRHVPAEQVDRQVLAQMRSLIQGHEDLLAAEAAKMLGQNDPFSIAMLEQQMKNIDQQFDLVLNAGLPENGRAYIGMMGFRVRINYHGDVLEVIQPGATGGPEEE